jgi:hypothetical protein
MSTELSLLGLGSAIGLGLLIGVIRKRVQSDPSRAIAGIRTHQMLALAGVLGAALGTPVRVVALLSSVVAVNTVGAWHWDWLSCRLWMVWCILLFKYIYLNLIVKVVSLNISCVTPIRQRNLPLRGFLVCASWTRVYISLVPH